MTISFKQPMPGDLRKELPDYYIPWGISKRLFGEMKTQDIQGGYKKVQVLPSDPEWRFIWRYFHHDKPLRYGIKKVFCVHERHQQQAFELNLSSLEREADNFPPTWRQEPRAAQRAKAIERWRQAADMFSPFNTVETDGRRRNWQKTKVLPLWHGSSEEAGESVATSGFVYFGKTSLGGVGPKSTDEGFFGSGIYFTNSSRYASDIYSRGHIFLAWVSMREPFPVVGDPTKADMKILQGRGHYKDYNAHYVPVTSINPSDPYEAYYYPTKEGEKPHCDEIVVFHKSQTLPRFWVELQVELPHLPSDVPQFVEDLIPHLMKLLQNPHVDRDKKLRNYLGQELGFLLTLEEDDYLEERHENLFTKLRQLFDTQGRVNRQVSRALTGSPQPSGFSTAQQPLPSKTTVYPSTSTPSAAPSSNQTFYPNSFATQEHPPQYAAPSYPTKPMPAVPIQSKIVSSYTSLPDIAFGKAKWEKYFGSVGVEPPLPSNINAILNAPCTFWSDKKVRNSHFLVLIPEKVNGKPFTLNYLADLIQKPKSGHAAKYSYYHDDVKKELGEKSYHSHWALMTKDVVPKSRSIVYVDQCKLMSDHSKRTNLPYELPLALEAAVCILMEHVQTGKRLYRDDPLTYTRCQEKVCNNKSVLIGGFEAGGLDVCSNCYDDGCYDGVAGLWKFC
jgi:hypothetical protein